MDDIADEGKVDPMISGTLLESWKLSLTIDEYFREKSRFGGLNKGNMIFKCHVYYVVSFEQIINVDR